MNEPFAVLSQLLLPQEDGAAVRAGPGWRLENLPEAFAVVWGREPWPAETSLARAAGSAAARERRLTRLRRTPPRGMSVAAIHRWPPPGKPHGVMADAARRALLGGAVAELVRKPVPRVIDLCAAAAGAAGPVRDIQPVSAGAVIARAVARPQTKAVLRATHRDGPGDPLRAAVALERLRQKEWPFVPRSLSYGRLGDSVWAFETELPGRRPRRLTGSLMLEVREFCGGLPPGEDSATVGPDIEIMAAAFPNWGHRLRRIADWSTHLLATAPSVMSHGDLWSGNLLAARGRLSGVIDWDSWRASGVPGTDLLHLYGTDRAVRSGIQLGAVWVDRPWRSPTFASWTKPYWRSLGIRPDTDFLDAVGVAWWASRVAYRLTVRPSLAEEQSWVTGTIQRVLDAVEP